MIYLDPPYGIKFGSNWQVTTRKRDVKDGKVEDATRQPEQIRAFRDTWELGIHSYLRYLRDRLVVARELLTETGSIFVQIGDENVHWSGALLDEVFGSENFVSLDHVHEDAAERRRHELLLGGRADYLLWYARTAARRSIASFTATRSLGGAGAAASTTRSSCQMARGGNDLAGEGGRDELLADGSRVYRLDNLTSQSVGARRREQRRGSRSSSEARTYRPEHAARWKTNRDGMAAARCWPGAFDRRWQRLCSTFATSMTFRRSRSRTLWTDIGGIRSFADAKVYVVQTNTKVVERCLLMTTDPGDLVLDPTCGIGTTAYVAEQWGRRWITIDTVRVALALARTRLMAAQVPVLPARRFARRAAQGGRADRPARCRADRPTSDIRKGFVYKRVPHVTLKSIAHNPDIHEGMTREEIDAAIARHAEHGAALRPALRGRQAHPRDRAVHGREPVAPPRAADERRPAAGAATRRATRTPAASRR